MNLSGFHFFGAHLTGQVCPTSGELARWVNVAVVGPLATSVTLDPNAQITGLVVNGWKQGLSGGSCRNCLADFGSFP